MNSDECKTYGNQAEMLVNDLLVERGFQAVRQPDGDPFDILVYKDFDPNIGLEVKYLGASNGGTRIDKPALRRKEHFAETVGLSKTLTVIVTHDWRVGFREGIENKPKSTFNYDIKEFVQEMRT